MLTCRDFYDCPLVDERPCSSRHYCPHADGSAVARCSVGLRRKRPVSAVLCRSAFQNLHPPCCVIEQCTITEKLLTRSYPQHKQTFSVGIYNEQIDTADEFFYPLRKKIKHFFHLHIFLSSVFDFDIINVDSIDVTYTLNVLTLFFLNTGDPKYKERGVLREIVLEIRQCLFDLYAIH